LIKGLPKESIYKGIEEEIAALRREGAGSGTSIGGDGSPVDDTRRAQLVPVSNTRQTSADDVLLEDGE
jgi:hypothetical protein